MGICQGSSTLRAVDQESTDVSKARAPSVIDLSDLPAQVWVKDPCQRGIRVGRLLQFFEDYCGSITFHNVDVVRPVCLSTKLTCKCHEANEDGTDRPYSLEPNLHGVNSLFILPQTAGHRVSMSELWMMEETGRQDSGGLMIEMFVSHTWGEKFEDFVQSIYHWALLYAETKKQKEMPFDTEMGNIETICRQISLYVCAFSNNQHNLKEELGEKVEKSPFYIILESKNTQRVILNLDETACALDRIWCAFEFWKASAEGKPYTLNTELGPLDNTNSHTTLLEAWTLNVFQILQTMDLSKAKATNESDRRLILNKMTTYVDDHGNTGPVALNLKLKALISEKVLPILAKTGDPVAIKAALDVAVDPNTRDEHGVPILTWVLARHGRRSDAARVLLARTQVPNRPHPITVVTMFETDLRKSEEAIVQVSSEANTFYATALQSAQKLFQQRKVSNLSIKLQDGNVDVRKATLFDVACSSIDNNTAVRMLLGKLDDENSDIRVMTLRMLVWPPGSSAGLGQLFEGMDVRVREKITTTSSQFANHADPMFSAAFNDSVTWEVGAQGKVRRYVMGEDATISLADDSSRCITVPPEYFGKLHVRSKKFDAVVQQHIDRIVVRLCEAESADVRAAARDVLNDLGISPDLYAHYVVRHLEDTSAIVRIEACKLLGGLGEAAAVHGKAISSCLNDRHLHVREHARESLIALVPHILVNLGDRDAGIRKQAGKALAAVSEEAQLRASVLDGKSLLWQCLSDSDAGVRKAGCMALAGSIDMDATSEHVALIAKLLEDTDAGVRKAACLALSRTGKRITAYLDNVVMRLSDEDGRVRGAACLALGNVEALHASHVTRIAALLHDDDASIRKDACLAIGALGTLGAQHSDHIAACLADANAHLRRAASTALWKMGIEWPLGAYTITDQVANVSGHDGRSVCTLPEGSYVSIVEMFRGPAQDRWLQGRIEVPAPGWVVLVRSHESFPSVKRKQDFDPPASDLCSTIVDWLEDPLYTTQSNDERRNEVLAHLDRVRCGLPSSPNSVTVYRNGKLHHRLVSACAAICEGCPVVQAGCEWVRQGNFVVKNLSYEEIHALIACIKTLEGLMTWSTAIVEDLIEAKPPDLPLISFLILAPKSCPSVDPALLTSSIRCLCLMLNRYSKNGSLRAELFEQVVEDIDFMRGMLECLSHMTLNNRELYLMCQTHEVEANLALHQRRDEKKRNRRNRMWSERADGVTSEQLCSTFWARMCAVKVPNYAVLDDPVMHRVIEALLTLLLFFMREAKADRPGSEAARKVSQVADESNREGIVLPLWQMPSLAVAEAALQCIKLVDVEQLDSYEVWFIIDTFRQKHVFAGEGVFLVEIIHLLRDWVDGEANNPIQQILLGDLAEFLITTFMDVLATNLRRNSRGDPDDEEEKQIMIRECSQFLTCVFAKGSPFRDIAQKRIETQTSIGVGQDLESQVRSLFTAKVESV